MKDILILAGIAIMIFIIIGIMSELKRHGIHRVLWRHFSGMPYHGKCPTNSTWLRRATKVHTDSGIAPKFYHMPRMHRAGIKTFSTLIIITIAIGIFMNRSTTIHDLIITGIVLTVIGLFLSVRALRKYYTNRVIATPMAMALAPMLAIPEKETQKAIDIAPNALTIREGEIGRITIPPQFPANPAQREMIQHLVESRMPMDIDFAWHTKKLPMHLALLAAPKPPTMVPFAQYIDLMEKCEPGQTFFGLDRKHDPYYGSFKLDDPHWGFSVGSGRGKSTKLQSDAAQILHNDPLAEIYAIDPKFSSLTPLVGVPGVEVACNPLNVPEFWRMIDKVKSKMMDRLERQKKDPTIEFPPIILMVDELNTFAAMTRTHWSMIQVGEPIDVRDIVKPGKMALALTWGDIAQILWMGRQANVHIIVCGQRLDDRATGGIGLRDSLGLRGLAGYRKNQWDMMFGTTPVQKSQKPKGRWIYSDGQDEIWVQNVYGTPTEIRDYAMANRIASVTSAENASIPNQNGRPVINLVMSENIVSDQRNGQNANH
jgi:hypothetical protein